MKLVTFIVPVAAHHAEIAQRAINSALAQTIPSEVVTAVDEENIGAGAMRNLLAQTVKTPFLVFLDADDEAMPDFVEKTIGAYRRGKYVYTAWLDDDGKFHEAPVEKREGVFGQGQFHTITTLIPTALFRLAGGFDETLAGLEDVDLFMKLQTLGVCGVRCEEPLMRYNRKAGKRASGIRASGQREEILDLLTQRYEGKLRMCSWDCTGQGKGQQAPANQPQEGDILVEALYAPTKQSGPVSGRVYPRTGNRRRMYVDPRDMLARPNWWQVPPEVHAEMISPAVDEVTRLATEALGVYPDGSPVSPEALQAAADDQGVTVEHLATVNEGVFFEHEIPKPADSDGGYAAVAVERPGGAKSAADVPQSADKPKVKGK